MATLDFYCGGKSACEVVDELIFCGGKSQPVMEHNQGAWNVVSRSRGISLAFGTSRALLMRCMTFEGKTYSLKFVFLKKRRAVKTKQRRLADHDASEVVMKHQTRWTFRWISFIHSFLVHKRARTESRIPFLTDGSVLK